jgi:transposase
MGKKRRQYTREFKLDALRLVAEGRPVAEVARAIGVHVNTLHGWRAQLADDPAGAFPGHGKPSEKDQEIRELKKALKRVTQERDILKKAVAYFADEGD